MKKTIQIATRTLLASSLALAVGTAGAHDLDEAGTPVCLEANYMMADAQNTPFGSATGAGRVIEMNIITGTPGITVGNPFNPGNASTDICPADVTCPGAWKPTGVLSGGENGHAFISSAFQTAMTQMHRDGTPIKSVSFKSLLGSPTVGGPQNSGGASLPRVLGSQLMPNGNLIQAICDANFFNAFNSDPMGPGESGRNFPGVNGSNPLAPVNNSSNLYFPPVYATDERQSNSRLLVIDQVTMEVIDEYSRPKEGKMGHGLWGCFAGIMFADDGLYVSTFHGGAVLKIDWKKGVEETSCGVGCNDKYDDDDDDDGAFALGKKKNRAKVTEVIDFRLGEPEDNSGWRRDSLRAISFDESGNIYATDRERSEKCVRGQAPGAVANPDPAGTCTPRVFRQRVNIASFDGYNDPALRRTIGLDPGVNVIAGIRTNRMSALACDHVNANAHIYATEYSATGYAAEADLCDVETLLVASSAYNPGCDANNDGLMGPGHPANPCMKPGGGVGEYIIHPNFTDGGAAYGGATCTGTPGVSGVDTMASTGNDGCAQPVAKFVYTNAAGVAENVDPRMLMVIHEAFGQ